MICREQIIGSTEQTNLDQWLNFAKGFAKSDSQLASLAHVSQRVSHAENRCMPDVLLIATHEATTSTA